MKIAILNDLHFGVRNTNQRFKSECDIFLNDTFFPFIEKNNIKILFIAGDFFDERRAVSTAALNYGKHFLEKINEKEIRTFMILGNHDIHLRNSLYPNSISPIIGDLPYINLIDEPTDIIIDNIKFLFIPWICQENYDKCLKSIENTNALYAVTHLDVKGSIDHGVVLNGGFDSELFDKFHYVLNGHIHTRGLNGRVLNLGTQYQWSWSDYGQIKGFHVFDTEKKEIEFVSNPRKIFLKFYSDGNNIENLSIKEWSKSIHLENESFIKFIMNGPISKKMTKFIDDLSINHTIDVQNLFTSSAENIINDNVIIGGTTLDFLIEEINNSTTHLKKDILIKFATQLHVEALNK